MSEPGQLALRLREFHMKMREEVRANESYAQAPVASMFPECMTCGGDRFGILSHQNLSPKDEVPVVHVG
jgi:hypothetical protein